LRLIGSFQKAHQDSEFADELESNLRMDIEDNVRSGMTPEEGRRQAVIRLGGIESVKEKYRDRSGIPVLESFSQDFRYGIRALGKSPGFTLIALCTLALCIGANTAVFSLLNALVLRSLPVRHPEQLAGIYMIHPNGGRGELSFPLFEEIQRRQRTFSELFAYSGGGVSNVEADGQLTQGDIWEVTGNFFFELGVPPVVGRLLEPADVKLEKGARADIAVIGYGLWQRYYAGDPDVVGKTVRVEGIPFTIVGVMQKGFTGMSIANEVDVALPLDAAPLIFGEDPDSMYTSRSSWLSVTGRLREGVSQAQAQADLESLWPEVLESVASGDRGEPMRDRVEVESAARGSEVYLRSRFARPVGALLGVSVLILIITCVNLASLALARTGARGHEMGIRAALGASRLRLARQVFIENLMLSLLGAAAGLAMAFWATLWLRNTIMRTYIVPPALNVGPDTRVLAFAAGITVLTCALFSIAPIWKVTRQDAAGGLHSNSRITGPEAGRLAKSLITTQVAMSLALLMTAGLFARSLDRLKSASPGFRISNVLVAGLFPVPAGYNKLDDNSYYPELVSRVSKLPGVRSAGISHMRPLSNITGNHQVTSTSRPEAVGADADLQMVSPGLFETLGMGIVQGRDFNWQDDAKSPRVGILGRRLAQELFPSGPALGQRIQIGGNKPGQDIEVVGIVSDASFCNLRKPESLEVYIPLTQGYAQWSELVVWTDGPPEAVAGAVDQEVAKMGHEYAFRTSTLASQRPNRFWRSV
jgi:predicted permease